MFGAWLRGALILGTTFVALVGPAIAAELSILPLGSVGTRPVATTVPGVDRLDGTSGVVIQQVPRPSGRPIARTTTISLNSGGGELPVVDEAFDWTGFYAGVFGVGQWSIAEPQGGVGIDIGANAQLEFVLVGGEVTLAILGDGSNVPVVHVEGLGRLGLAITDDVVAYAAAGAGVTLNGSKSEALLGGGVEFALADDVTVDSRYLHGFGLAGAGSHDRVTFGANFHF